MPAIRASAPDFVFKRALLDDFRAEPLCGAPKRRGEGLIVGPGSVHQEPAPPLLPDHILRQCVDEHRP